MSQSRHSSAEDLLPDPDRQPIAASTVVRRHPDHRTAWIIVLLVRLAPGGLPPLRVLLDRLESAVDGFPLMASRLRGSWWVPAPGPGISVVREGEPLAQAPLQPFALAQEPPVRVVTSSEGDWLLLCAHHFAFDGLGMVTLLRQLLGGEASTAPDYTKMSSPGRPPIDGLRRLLRPADRIAPSATLPSSDSFVARQVQLSGPGVTARLARACAAAAVAHNAQRGHPMRRIGLSVAVGGVGGEAATYRRLDVIPGQDVEAAVAASLGDPRVPSELVSLPPGSFVLRPVLQRFSDTILVSNLGRLELPGATSVAFYPVARGRSATAVGAVSISGQPTTLTLRARDLSPVDAAALLERVVAEVGRDNERPS